MMGCRESGFYKNEWNNEMIDTFLWLFQFIHTVTLPLSSSCNPQNWENDGRYDWMDSSIKKFPDTLPKHVRTANNTLVPELLVPAPRQFRETYKEGKKSCEVMLNNVE